jgi:hypothetical protein
MTLKYNITESTEGLHVGEKFTLNIPIVDRVSGAAVALTDMDLRCVLSVAEGGTALVTKTTGGSGITLDDSAATDDEAVVAFDAADTEDLAPGTYHYMLQRTDTQAVLKKGFIQLARATW